MKKEQDKTAGGADVGGDKSWTMMPQATQPWRVPDSMLDGR